VEDEEEEEEEEEEVELDKEDKEKPRAKRTKVYKSQPRRSSRLVKMGTARDSRRVPCSSAEAPIQKMVNSEQEDNGESSVESKESSATNPAHPAAAAKKSNDESITEPETSNRPKRTRRPVAKPGTSVVGWSSESEEEFFPTKKLQRNRKSETLPRRFKKPKRRCKFTEEEMEAIREGVRRFGKGNWTTIRINSGGVLLSRTNVNIKDCYRTMEKRGEGL
jgi:hypothetical protein